MLSTTLSRLKCPSCSGALSLTSTPKAPEVRSGSLVCQRCRAQFLILAGVALLVEETYDYLMTHVKGISKVVKDHEIPPEFRNDYREAKAALKTEHIEEDLEAERVNSLYLMNHYLKTESKPIWWKPLAGDGSPLIDQLIREHWDQGPFTRIGTWVSELTQNESHGESQNKCQNRYKNKRFKAAVELGCGVGGLHKILKPHCNFYLGVDSSFASIALARHLALGAPYPHSLRLPGDLLQGSVSRTVKIPVETSSDGKVDFVVMDFKNPAIAKGWDLTLSLNMIDMLDEPAELPRLQSELLEKNGVAIQSCPYIWHEAVAKTLRKVLPREIQEDSARAVEWLYRRAGFEIEKSIDHQPWLFFKHLRQLEIYSVHLFSARKK